jgi:Aldehyde dehydrogenase family
VHIPIRVGVRAGRFHPPPADAEVESHRNEHSEDCNTRRPSSDPETEIGPLISPRAVVRVRPVAPVVTWQEEAELLHHVNGTEYGLAAHVFSGRLQDALRLAEAFGAGMVGINRGVVSDPAAPFGGVKQSGLGREGGREGIREFQETQYFSVDLG